VADLLPPGYRLRPGSGLERSLLLKFLQKTYQELYPDGHFSHLAYTIEQYFSQATPLWWVELAADSITESSYPFSTTRHSSQPVACLWMGISIDQLRGDRHTHIFLLYVALEHRRQGIGRALMHQAEAWARERGDRQIGLQVFESNQPALALYRSLGYQTQSLWMVKPLTEENSP
jgi:ribosomal protein S18 acetylase RimI-like enzyme